MNYCIASLLNIKFYSLNDSYIERFSYMYLLIVALYYCTFSVILDAVRVGLAHQESSLSMAHPQAVKIVQRVSVHCM